MPQKAKTTARIAPKNAPAPTWGLVPAAADGETLVPTATAVADLDTLDPEGGVVGLDTLGPEEGLDTLGRPEDPELTGTEVNETGLGVGVAVKEGVIPPINGINNGADLNKKNSTRTGSAGLLLELKSSLDITWRAVLC